jgi:glycine/D-amino acid oxidase-like deaminating enzyme
MPVHSDAMVIGAGVVGAATALALVRAGLSVEVLDASFAASGATAAGMGHIVVMDDSEAQFALTSFSRSLLDEVADELPAACEFERCGTLWIARDDDDMTAVRAKRDFYTSRGVAAELLDAEQLAEAEPRLAVNRSRSTVNSRWTTANVGSLAGALLVPGDAVLYPPALAWWLLDRAAGLGVRVREGRPVDSVVSGGVVIQGVRHDTGVVVNATGAAAPSLTPGIPIVPRKGHLAITDRHPGLCRHQLVELGYLTSAHTMSSESVAFNLQPRATGQVLIGSSRELVGWDAQINRRVLGQMLARAVAFTPALADVSVLRVWTGFRPATPDKLPLIGPWDGAEDVWIAAGHEGLGITTALGTAALIADLITGRTPAIDPTPFAPGRASVLVEA